MIGTPSTIVFVVAWEAGENAWRLGPCAQTVAEARKWQKKLPPDSVVLRGRLEILEELR